MDLRFGSGGERGHVITAELRRLAECVGLLAVSVFALLQADVRCAQAVQKQAAFRMPLPVRAEGLLPLKRSGGVYRVKEGPEEGREVPFTLEGRGDRWLLTKKGLTSHELYKDEHGNILILRETDFLENRQVEYDPPVILLPAVVNGSTSVSGKTRITIRNARTGAVTHRGTDQWQLVFAGIHTLETSKGLVSVYFLQLNHQVTLPLVQASLRIDFGYTLGKGMVVTSVEQADRVLGLFSNRTTWRLEQPAG